MSIVNDAVAGVTTAAPVILPGSFLEIIPGPKAGLSLGVGLAGVPPGSLTVVIDDGGAPAFTLAIVNGAGTWTRVDTGAAIA